MKIKRIICIAWFYNQQWRPLVRNSGVASCQHIKIIIDLWEDSNYWVSYYDPNRRNIPYVSIWCSVPRISIHSEWFLIQYLPLTESTLQLSAHNTFIFHYILYSLCGDNLQYLCVILQLINTHHFPIKHNLNYETKLCHTTQARWKFLLYRWCVVGCRKPEPI